MFKKIGVLFLSGTICLSTMGLALAMEYKEAPMIRTKVAAGELPPVEERLPMEPEVIEPVEEIGQYGGTWSLLGGGDVGGLLFLYCNEGLVRWDRKGKNIIPNIAKSWEISEGAKTFTFHLREGMKWSDGYPFTTEDMMFWYEDILNNKELTPAFPTRFTVGGEPVKIEKIDDYTITFRFAKPSGFFLANLTNNSCSIPKHYMKQFHPRYTPEEELNKKVKEAGLDRWDQLFELKNSAKNPPYPTITAWVTKVATTDLRYVYERNPYYWKVDPAGNQLPYIDKVRGTTLDSQVIAMKTIAGEADCQSRNIDFKDYTLFMENREKGNYRVFLWPRNCGAYSGIFPNWHCNDEVLRKIIRDVRFRRALSLAMNREEINEFIFFGKGVPRQATVMSYSPLYKEEYGSAYAQHNPQRANELLDEIGLKWDKNHEYRLRSDGKTLSLFSEISVYDPTMSDIFEIVKSNWKVVGIDLIIKTVEYPLYQLHVFTGESEISEHFIDSSYMPLRIDWFLPVGYWPRAKYGGQTWGPRYAQWYVTNGEEGEEPPEFLKGLYDIWNEIEITADAEKKKQLYQEIFDAQAENLFVIGTVGEIPQPVIVKNNFRNVPEKSFFAYLIGAYYGLARVEQFFIKK